MKKIGLIFASLAAILALFGGMAGSSLPDGLESAAESLGFADSAGRGQWSPLAGYEWSAIDWEWPARASAGIFGAALLYGFGVLLGRRIRQKGDRSQPVAGVRRDARQG